MPYDNQTDSKTRQPWEPPALVIIDVTDATGVANPTSDFVSDFKSDIGTATYEVGPIS